MTREVAHASADAPVEEVMEIIERDGGVIIDKLFSREQAQQLDAEVVPLLDELTYGTRDEKEVLDDFFGVRTKRLTNLVADSPTFREHYLDNERILRYIDAMMLPYADSYWLCTGHVVDIHPGQKAQPLHRDMDNYPCFRPMGPASPEVMTNCIVALTDTTEELGATRVIPGSNHWPDYLDRGTPEQTVAAEMEAGSALLISGKVVHGGGANITQDRRRRVLLLAYNLGYLVPEEAHAFTVPMEIAKDLSPRAQQLLGFRSFHNESNEGGTLWGAHYQDLAHFLKLENEARA